MDGDGGQILISGGELIATSVAVLISIVGGAWSIIAVIGARIDRLEDDMQIKNESAKKDAREGDAAIWLAHNAHARDTQTFREEIRSKMVSRDDLKDAKEEIMQAINRIPHNGRSSH